MMAMKSENATVLHGRVQTAGGIAASGRAARTFHQHGNRDRAHLLLFKGVYFNLGAS
jgi:hypothetical protein